MTGRALRLMAVVGALWASAPASARGDGTVILVDGSVAQYEQTAKAVKARVKGAVTTIDLTKADDAAAAAQEREPRVIVAIGQKALAAVSGRVTTTPIVYATVLYPEKHGLTGDNVTGVPLEVPAAAQLGRFKTVAPRVKRVGVLYSKDSGALVEEATAAAKGLGLSIVARAVTSSSGVGAALDEIIDRIDALWLLPDAQIVSKDVFAYLLRATLDAGIPLFGFLEGFTQAGALASISPDYDDIGARAGDLANTIAAADAGQGTLPAKAYSSGALSINLKTAQRLGLDVADEAVDAAVRVFE
jgi:putative ABC transport system substrate-binding protein